MSSTGTFNGLPWWETPQRDQGTPCAECGRLKKVYHRALSSSMARGLIRLHALHNTYRAKKSFHVRLFDKEGGRGEFGVLAKWGLVIEVKDMTLHNKKSTGLWALTPFGANFVEMKERVPSHVVLKWGSQVLGFSGSFVTMKDCVERGNRFRYTELMDWKPTYGQEELFG